MSAANKRESAFDASVSDILGFQEALRLPGGELLRELVAALQTIRYGSILLTLHDGRIVEIQKTERIRTRP
jgi:hypothetical protein